MYDKRKTIDEDRFLLSGIIGFHESKRVCLKYIKMAENSEDLAILKVKEKLITEKSDYYDYYLVRYGNGYVQSKYFDLIEDDYKTSIKELVFAKEIIMKYMEFSDLTNGEQKALKKTCEFLEDKKEDIKNDIPSFNTLKIMEMEQEAKQVASYRWGIDVDDDTTWDI